MAARQQCSGEAEGYDGKQTSYKQVSWDRKKGACCSYATQIYESNDKQNYETQAESVRLQSGKSGDKGPDSSSNSHCHHKQIVNHEGCASEQSRSSAEILAGNNVRSSACGISSDSLPV